MTTATQPLAPQPFAALDDCHRKMLQQLHELQRMALHMESAGLSEADRELAAEIEVFFSSTSRAHHALEEQQVFAPLLANGPDALTAVVRSLQQDHGFIEENWTELGPQLRAIAEGNDWFEAAEFQHNVALFLALVRGHIALEESLIYPESQAQWADVVARRLSWE
jgi:hemerythrin-like domain-containing protein